MKQFHQMCSVKNVNFTIREHLKEGYILKNILRYYKTPNDKTYNFIIKNAHCVKCFMCYIWR